MSTICKICLIGEGEAVAASLHALLAEQGHVFDHKESEWPLAEVLEFLPSDAMPTVFSVKKLAAELVEVHFNSFSRLALTAVPLSRHFHAVIVYHFQSVATAAYWAYYLDGDLAREIESGDGEVFQDFGVPLAFERDAPRHLVETSGEPNGDGYYTFDDTDMDAYNAACGIPSQVYGDYESGWTNLVSTSTEKVVPPERRGWRRFWRR